MHDRISIRLESTGENTFANLSYSLLRRLRALIRDCFVPPLSAEQARGLAVTAVEP